MMHFDGIATFADIVELAASKLASSKTGLLHTSVLCQKFAQSGYLLMCCSLYHWLPAA